MKHTRWHLTIFLIIAFVALGAIGRDLWFQAIAFDPADYNLPPGAQEVVKLRTEKTVTFRLSGRKFVTIGKSPTMENGGPADDASGTGSSL